MNNLRDIVLKILETIDYQDDKEAFISEFIRNIQLQVIADLINSLPAHDQGLIKHKLGDVSNNPEKISVILKEQFSNSEFQLALKKTAQDSITKYIQSIYTILPEVQRDDLIKVLQEVGQSPTQIAV